MLNQACSQTEGFATHEKSVRDFEISRFCLRFLDFHWDFKISRFLVNSVSIASRPIALSFVWLSAHSLEHSVSAARFQLLWARARVGIACACVAHVMNTKGGICKDIWTFGLISRFQISEIQDFSKDFEISRKISEGLYEISGLFRTPRARLVERGVHICNNMQSSGHVI